MAAADDLNASAQQLRVMHPDLCDVIDSRCAELSRDLSLAGRDDPELYGTQTHLLGLAGHVRVAFRLAFWHLLHATSYEASLVDIVNRGGDSDTNGCIVGALLGARFGFTAIPERWVSMVSHAVSDRPSSPWWTDYHPRQLVSLLGLAEGTPR